MKLRILTGLSLLASALVLSGCFFHDSIRGSGTVVSESRDVKGFTGIELMGSGKLVIEQSDTESLSIKTDDNLMEFIVAKVENGTLKLYPKESFNLDPSSELTFTLLVKKLNKVGVSGGAEIDARGIKTDSLTIAVSGAAEIKITGETVDHKVAISGTGELSAEGFNSKSASISISGAGHAVLAVSDRLDVEVSGAGEVEYIGNPKVTENISGAGSVTRRS